MLKYVQGGPQGQEEDLYQPSTSSSSPGHQPPAGVDPATVPSPDQQQPSTPSSGTGTAPHTTTTESLSPVTERPSASESLSPVLSNSYFSYLSFFIEDFYCATICT